MSLTLVTGPQALPLTLAELNAGARLDGENEAVIMGHLRGAVDQIDGRDGGRGLALITQTWDYKLNWFPFQSSFARIPFADVRLPLMPVQSVTSIEYVDLAGVTQTLAANKYQVVGLGDSMTQIVPAFGETWPDTREQPEAVTIRFVAGYGDDANDVPEPIRQALTLMVREAFDGCQSDAPMHLLNSYQQIKRPGPRLADL